MEDSNQQGGGEYAIATPEPYSAESLVGKRLLERYHIRKLLGEGGMGAVYLASHTVLEKDVALKVLHEQFSRDPNLVTRFLQEARAASRIRHPNVIDITDFGSTPDGLVFFAMELLDGGDLHDIIDQHNKESSRLHWEETRRIFTHVCEALSVAHEKGVIHRDLKPENIFVCKNGNIKLLDFGIAKLNAVNDTDRKLTKTGMLFGTPEYMAPEQAKGQKADHRVDVYAMGCILYEMVTGKPPFESDNFMSILTKHLTEMPPELRNDELEVIEAPMGVKDVVVKALAKERDDRFQSIRELIDALDLIDSGRILKIPKRLKSAPISRVQTTVAPEGSSRKLLPWAALLVALVAVGAGAFLLLQKEEAPVTEAPETVLPGVTTGESSPGLVVSGGPAEITVYLATTPEKAEVYLGEQFIRHTPMEREFEVPSDGRLLFTLKKNGYEDQQVVVVGGNDFSKKVELVPVSTSGTKKTSRTPENKQPSNKREEKTTTPVKPVVKKEPKEKTPTKTPPPKSPEFKGIPGL